MSKKPAVAAKAARKTKLTKSEVELAKHFGVSVEEAAKAKLPKRGRPAGSKNKPTPFNKTPFTDWERLCGRLQEALAKEMKENDFLKDEICRKRNFFERLVCLVTGSV